MRASSAMRARNRGYYYVSSCALSSRASSTARTHTNSKSNHHASRARDVLSHTSPSLPITTTHQSPSVCIHTHHHLSASTTHPPVSKASASTTKSKSFHFFYFSFYSSVSNHHPRPTTNHHPHSTGNHPHSTTIRVQPPSASTHHLHPPTIHIQPPSTSNHHPRPMPSVSNTICVKGQLHTTSKFFSFFLFSF